MQCSSIKFKVLKLDWTLESPGVLANVLIQPPLRHTDWTGLGWSLGGDLL